MNKFIIGMVLVTLVIIIFRKYRERNTGFTGDYFLEQVDPDQIVEFLYICVFPEKDEANVFSEKISKLGYENTVVISQNGEMWWVKHNQKTTAGSSEKDELTNLLTDLCSQHGGVLGPVAVAVPGSEVKLVD